MQTTIGECNRSYSYSEMKCISRRRGTISKLYESIRRDIGPIQIQLYVNCYNEFFEIYPLLCFSIAHKVQAYGKRSAKAVRGQLEYLEFCL